MENAPSATAGSNSVSLGKRSLNMETRRPLLMLAAFDLILAVLGIAGYFAGGHFGEFVQGMTPFVLLGLSLLFFIVSRPDRQ